MKTVLNEQGQGLTEYIVLVMLISVVSIVAVRSLGATVKDKLRVARDRINQEVTVDGK
jgi:Flp pilus assembly pilin Flp